MLFAYALGKAQRLLAGCDAGIGPIYGHGAVQVCNAGYREAGIDLPACEYAGRGERGKDWDGALVVAPPGARGTPWLRKFRNYSAPRSPAGGCWSAASAAAGASTAGSS